MSQQKRAAGTVGVRAEVANFLSSKFIQDNINYNKLFFLRYSYIVLG
jgi:hypothetical protein